MSGAPKVYTRGGDQGQTSLIGGTRVSKGDLRLEVYGSVDELNSIVGLLRAEIGAAVDMSLQPPLQKDLEDIQRELFDLGSQLACEDKAVRQRLPNVAAADIARLEERMDEWSQNLKPLTNFVLPGGTRAASIAHLARTVCRRVERAGVRLAEEAGEDIDLLLIRYINRLSDYFFVLARFLNHVVGMEEPIWSAKTERAEKQSPS